MEVTLVYEGGGSRTRLGVYGNGDALLRSTEGGPSNPFDLGVERCAATLESLARQALLPGERPVLACAALAGAIAGADAAARAGERLADALELERVLLSNDLYPILLANAGGEDAVLAIAGTGSSVMAQSRAGNCDMAGGRGTLFGDRGSAYAIAAAALRAAGEAYDGITPPTSLVEALIDAVDAAGFPELVVWSRTASKTDVARLCPCVTERVDHDETARTIVTAEAHALGDHARAGARKVRADPHATILCYGGVFNGSRLFFDTFQSYVRECGHRGEIRKPEITGTDAVLSIKGPNASSRMVTEARPTQKTVSATPPTENVLDAERTLDTMNADEIVDAMSIQDERAVKAVRQAREPIARVIEAAARAVRDDGRVIYIGAGTSGRLGVLDASECPPTFGVAPERFMGLMAGGDHALRNSVEGAEDDREWGRGDIDALVPPVSSRDLVVGIAASGSTPYTLAALERSRERGAFTALICCNPRVASGADVVIALDTGPEILAGSTRLKAGTATKLVLNMISTGAMALSGYVYRGLMVGVKPVNAKLWRRATGIVTAIADCPGNIAERCLRESDSHVPTAIVMARFKISRDDAGRRLKKHGGMLHRALEE